MATVNSVSAELDGLGPEIVIGTDDRRTIVMNGGTTMWSSGSPLNGPAGAWVRNTVDLFYAADLDGDGRQEIVIANDHDGWTGVLKWQYNALQPIWMSPSPLGGWKRGSNDFFIPADLDNDGKVEIFIANNHDGWTGVLKWQGGQLEPIWMSPSPLHGPAGQWNRRGTDQMSVIPYNGNIAIAIDSGDGLHGVLTWDGDALQVVQLSKD